MQWFFRFKMPLRQAAVAISRCLHADCGDPKSQWPIRPMIIEQHFLTCPDIRIQTVCQIHLKYPPYLPTPLSAFITF